MDPFAAYLPIKHGHVSLVAASVTLFAARGIGVLSGARWPLHAGPRLTSVAVDALLLASSATLGPARHQPLQQHRLGVKLVLLIVYIALGTLALKRARSTVQRALFFATALACVAFMASVAITHDPRGVFAG